MRLPSLIFLLLIWYGTIAAQPWAKIVHYSTDEGLSERWANAVVADELGYVWVGTEQGLYRFDGHRFKAYYASLPQLEAEGQQNISWLKLAPDGTLLASTSEGLLRFDPSEEAFEFLGKTDNPHSVYQINLPGMATFWRQKRPGIGHFQIKAPFLSLVRITGALDSQQDTLSLPAGNPKLVLIGGQPSHLWFWAYEQGYFRLGLESQQWEHFPIDLKYGPNLPIDMKGQFWYPSPDGHGLMPMSLPQLTNAEAPQTILIDDGELYLLTEGRHKSIYHLDASAGVWACLAKVESAAPSAWPVPADLFRDSNGYIWMAHFQGLTQIVPVQLSFETYGALSFGADELPPVGMSMREITALKEGELLVRIQSGLLKRIDLSTHTVSDFNFPDVVALHGSKPPPNEEVTSLFQTNSDTIWAILDRQYLIAYSIPDETAYSWKLPHYLKKVFSDDEAQTWLVTPEDGLLQFTPQSPFLINRVVDIPGHTLMNKLYARQDTSLVYLATKNGTLLSVDLTLSKADTLVSNQVSVCYQLEYRKGIIWAATDDGLLGVDPRSRQQQWVKKAEGLPGRTIYNMEPQGDILWLGTSKGLCRFNTASGTLKKYYLEDGLPHFEFNSLSHYTSSGGEIFLGTLNGILGFNPPPLVETRSLPKLYLAGVQLYNNRTDTIIKRSPDVWPAGEALEIAPSIGRFVLQLRLDDLETPRLQRFAWKLDPVESNWNLTDKQSEVAFNQLAPGRYTFRAKGADARGNWSENELVLPIIVRRPWYLRWWALVIFGALLSALGYRIYRMQLQRRVEAERHRKLRELSELKDQFFTKITHEFRTPLTLILGMAERAQRMAANGANSNALQQNLRLIQEGGERLLHMINQILSLTKLDRGSIVLDYQKGDLRLLVQQLAEPWQHQAAEQGVELKIKVPGQPVQISYAEKAVVHIVNNLLSNAVKFTPKGGRVAVEMSYSEGEVGIKVADTGVGIAAVDQPQVFNRYFQTQTTAQKHELGVGIGLAIVREMVDHLGGEVAVESPARLEPGKGSAFEVRWPVPKEETEGPLPVTAPVEKGLAIAALESRPGHPVLTVEQPLSGSGRRPTLLLIEDHPEVRAYIRSCLTPHYQLVTASDGAQGVDLAIAEVPDLIVSDVMLPVRDGFEVCEQLRANPVTNHIPILLLTAKAGPDNRIDGLSRGADAYLEKPFYEKELLVTLRRLLEARQQMQKKYSQVMQPAFEFSSDSHDENEVFLRKLRQFYKEALSDTSITLDDTAKHMNLSRSSLGKKVKAITGMTPMALLKEMRLEFAKQELLSTDKPISEIAYACGFADPRYFSRAFSSAYGCAPSQFREKA